MRQRTRDDLESRRLTLRRLTEADLANLVELDSDPMVMRYLSGGTATPPDVIEREILPAFLRSYEPEGFGVWAAVETSSGQFVGWIALRPTKHGADGEASLGYRLRRSAWGKGYATEGARVLIRRGFAELGARRVVATTYQDNRASRRVLEKLGMTLVRRYRMTPDEFAAQDTFKDTSQEPWDGDELEYALEAEEWQRLEAPAAAE
jgi:RimJ/RimL family protein N-acetyltransferase